MSTVAGVPRRLEESEVEHVPEPHGADPIAGKLVTTRFSYDGGRSVTVYVPRDPPEAIVYAGDGQLIARWGAGLEAAADLLPTMIVGVHRTDDPDELARIREYSPSFEPRTFAEHEQFFVHDVREWVRAALGISLPANRTAVCGVSASAELALAMGMRHPDIYGAVLAASPGGGYQPPEVMPQRLPRVYLVAGTLEPWFAANATRWVDALRNAGGEVESAERVGGHGDPFWEAELASMVAWAFSA